MPNGNIRAYQGDTDDKRGVSELQFTNPLNPSPTILAESNNVVKVFFVYETV